MFSISRKPISTFPRKNSQFFPTRRNLSFRRLPPKMQITAVFSNASISPHLHHQSQIHHSKRIWCLIALCFDPYFNPFTFSKPYLEYGKGSEPVTIDSSAVSPKKSATRTGSLTRRPICFAQDDMDFQRRHIETVRLTATGQTLFQLQLNRIERKLNPVFCILDGWRLADKAENV